MGEKQITYTREPRKDMGGSRQPGGRGFYVILGKEEGVWDLEREGGQFVGRQEEQMPVISCRDNGTQADLEQTGPAGLWSHLAHTLCGYLRRPGPLSKFISAV